MNAQHTPGRLKVADDNSLGSIVAKDDTAIGHTFQVSAQDQLNGSPIRKANARRLVACWNACEGLTTEHLENIDMLGETLAGRFAAFHASERELMDTRDDLLAALKSVMETMDDETSSDAELAFALSDPECPASVKGELACVIACRAAIAKVGGKA